MFRNYIIITLRSLQRDAKSTFINVAGLTIGMTAFFLIMLWVNNQVSYDDFHPDIDQVYRVMADRSQDTRISIAPNTPYPLAEILQQQSGIDKVARIMEQEDLLLSTDKHRQEENINFADQEFLEIFHFPLKEGNSATALTDQNSILLTSEQSLKYFGEGSPLGKTIHIKGWGYERDMTVTGVLADIPANSSMKFDFLIPIQVMASEFEWLNHWGTAGLFTYVKLKEGADYREVSAIIKDIPGQHHDWVYDLFLFPASKIYLYNVFQTRAGGGRITYIYIFTLSAVLILLLACINFTNLSTAQAGRRAREIGVRKTMGANAMNVRVQIVFEGILIALCAMIVSISLVQILLPFYNELLGTQFDTGWISWEYLISMFIIAILTGILAGGYPAIIYARFNPVDVLKSSFASATKLHWSKQALVIFQLVISVIMITSAIVVYRQVNFLNTSELGFEKDDLMYFYIHEKGVYGHHEEFATILKQHPGIEEVTYLSQNPLQVYQTSGDPAWEGKNPEVAYPPMAFIDVDYEVEEVLGIEIIKGRSFSRDIASDTSAFIINEKAASIIGEDAVGKQMSFWDKEGEIIGVFKNFHHLSFHNEINPMILRYWRGNTTMCFLRAESDVAGILAFIEQEYKKYETEFPFTYQFVDREFENMYNSEKQIQVLTLIFAVLVIIISALGLYGLVAFVMQGQTKMIGIRKVLGATTGQMVRMFTGRFTLWVFISLLIAFPVSYYLLQMWLTNFVYRVDIRAEEFMFASLVILLVTVLTILARVIRASRVNPVDCLKNE